MPHQISTVTNTPTDALPYSLAHYNLLRAIRDFCGGYGVIGTVNYTGTGNGTMTGIEASPTSVTETWTVTCTATAVDGGTFSVTGSVSGVKASATVGTPYDNGLLKFTISDGATDFILGDSFSVPVTQGAASAAGIAYDILRYTTVGGEASGHELIMRAHGLTGTEEIYLGLRTYHSVSGDYYNLLGGVFTGYVAENTFDTQPGAALVGMPAHNINIGYWLTMNGQRIALTAKVEVYIFEHLYLGKFFPYARPSQYPYPVIAGGMLAGAAATRFSETTHDFYLRGGNARGKLRTPGGWINMYCWPWQAGTAGNYICGASTSALSLQARYTGSGTADANYPLLPIQLNDNSASLYGTLDGIYHVSGFDNVAENTITIGADTYVMTRSVARTGHTDYYALKLDN